MSIFVIRHADKKPGEFYGKGLKLNDQPISEKGQRKAQKLVGYFDKVDIDAIYISEYIRTKQTIMPVASRKGIIPIIDPRLNEIDIGDIEKMTDEQVQQKYPDFWNAYIERNHDFGFPNGETGEEASKRIMSVFATLDHFKNYILVAHDGIIRTLICSVLSIPPYKRHLFKADVCSITIFEYLDDFHCWSIPKINIELS
ncbi:MAG: histidine phosphatase family protein [Spirochaetales bacterium]|nr:histidine phosphatase family protein [Spirochaetales bacterium]